VVTVIAAVLAAVLGYRASRAQADPAAAAPAKDAVASAADATETLLSFRYDTLARELDEEASLMTQAYAQRFGSTFSAQARARLTEQQMMTESTVLAAARLECGEDCPSDRVQVLVFFDKMTTKGAGDPEYTPDRAILSMQRDGSVWLVDEIRTV
jgi:methylphosphotriester-DNA--protein-cysteine methyltransferase